MYEVTKKDLVPTESVARWIHEYKFQSAPEAIKKDVNILLLDCLGVMLASSVYDLGKRIVQTAEAISPNGKISVPGSTSRFDVVTAGLVTGTLGHGIELDEVHLPSRQHIGASVCAAGFAAGQYLDASLSAVREAVLVGYEISGHLGVAFDNDKLADHSFHGTGVIGGFGCAALVSRLLGLNSNEIFQALGLTASQASGTLAWHTESHHMSKSFQVGLTARNGITAAIMAKHGYCGPSAVFAGPCNVFAAFRNEDENSEWYSKLGKEYEILNSGRKMYAAGRPMHAALDALLTIMKRDAITTQDIESIEVRMPPGAARIVDGNHTNNIDCTTVVATAAVDGCFGLTQMDDERMNRKDAQDMKKRTKLVHDTGLNQYFPQTWPATVIIRTRDKREGRETVVGATGERDRPLNEDAVTSKFLDLAKPIVGDAVAQELAQRILGSEDCKISEIARLFAQPKK